MCLSLRAARIAAAAAAAVAAVLAVVAAEFRLLSLYRGLFVSLVDELLNK